MNIPSNIYNFMDYREFLKDRYRQLKDNDPMFSFRFFSKEAGFGSPNYLKLVMDGKRNLSDEAIAKFAKGLRLDSHESEYFRYCVQFNQCENIHKKKVFEAKLLYLRELFKVKNLIPELYDYYHEWFHAAIREMIKKGGMKNNPLMISQNLVPAISETEAAASITLLKKLNFITETPDGVLACTTAAEVDSATTAMAQKIHYEQMAELATESIYTQGPETQDFETMTLSMPPAMIAEVKTKIRELIESLSKTHGGSPGDAVYQLNVQFFALTKQSSTREEERRAAGANEAA
ncbi:MAG: TIGR02147 family protein [Deltaproteobacteria bacterium]|nr:TIGR02147 family protein [Deltaproteobacteria bacterium]